MKNFDLRRAVGGGAARQLRSEAAKQVTGKMYCHAFLSEGEKEVVNEPERILQPQERGWQKTLQTIQLN